MPAVEPVTSAVFPERSIFMCHLHPKRFRAKHALGLDPRGAGSREENAPKLNDADGDIGRRTSSRNRRTGICLPNKKRRPEAPLLKLDLAKALRRLGFLFLHGTGIQALGIDVAIDEFDHGHRRVVAVAEAGLDDAGIAAMTVLVAGRQNGEQLLDLM